MLIGLDVSTNIIGISWLCRDGTFIDAHYCDLRKINDVYEKCDVFQEYFKHHTSYNSVNKIFIEEKLSGFAGGGSSQQTMMKLGSFNGSISYLVYKETGIKPIHIHPSTIKATMKRDGLNIPKGLKGDKKKKVVLDFCMSKYKHFFYEETRNGNPQKYCYDAADAYCVVRTGFIKGL